MLWIEGGCSKADARRLWITGALDVLKEVDDAIRWNATSFECWLGTTPTKGRPTRVRPYVYDRDQQPTEWMRTLKRVILYFQPDGCHSVEAERDIVRRFDEGRYAVMQLLRFKRRVCAIWALRCVHGLEYFLIARRPPAYAWERRSTANHLRTLLRGGIHVFLGWSAYAKIRNTRVPLPPVEVIPEDGGVQVGEVDNAASASPDSGTRSHTVAGCPLCGAPLLPMHILRDCKGLHAPRMLYWGNARRLIREQGSTGPAALYEPDSTEAKDIWARITLGEDIRRDLVMGTALEPEDREQQRLIAALRASADTDLGDDVELPDEAESGADWDGYIALPPADNGATVGAWKPPKWASRLHVWSRLLATTGLFLAVAQQALMTAIDTMGVGKPHAHEVDAPAAPPSPGRQLQAAPVRKPPAPRRPRVLQLRDGGTLHPLAPESIVVGMPVYALRSAPRNPHHYPAEVTAVHRGAGAEGDCVVDVRYTADQVEDFALHSSHVMRYAPPAPAPTAVPACAHE